MNQTSTGCANCFYYRFNGQCNRVEPCIGLKTGFLIADGVQYPLEKLEDIPEIKGYSLPEEITINGQKYRRVEK